MEERLITVKDAAKILHLGPSTIRAMFLDGRLRRIKIGRATRIRKQEIDDLILYRYQRGSTKKVTAKFFVNLFWQLFSRLAIFVLTLRC